MSPNSFGRAAMYSATFVVDYHGGLNEFRTDSTSGVRPVINLASDVTITGSGTSSDPYVVI